MRMFRAWLLSGILQSPSATDKSSSKEKPCTWGPARSQGQENSHAMTLSCVRERLKKKTTNNPCPREWKYPQTGPESALKGFKIAYLVTQKPEHFPQHHQLAEAFKFKSKALSFVCSKAHQLTSYRFPSVSGFLKRKIPWCMSKAQGWQPKPGCYTPTLSTLLKSKGHKNEQKWRKLFALPWAHMHSNNFCSNMWCWWVRLKMGSGHCTVVRPGPRCSLHGVTQQVSYQ